MMVNGGKNDLISIVMEQLLLYTIHIVLSQLKFREEGYQFSKTVIKYCTYLKDVKQ